MDEPLVFPIVPGFSFVGGPMYDTTVIKYGRDNELRNRNVVYPLHSYTVTATREQDEIETLTEFFHVCGGKYEEFLFVDYQDCKSCRTNREPAVTDQLLAATDSPALRYPLIKTYTSAGRMQTRPIREPVMGSLVVGVAGAPVSGWTFDDDTGEIVFAAVPNGPVSAGFLFMVRCRFDSDQLQTTIEDGRVVSVSAPIIEVKRLPS